jgi:hypothetical protein
MAFVMRVQSVLCSTTEDVSSLLASHDQKGLHLAYRPAEVVFAGFTQQVPTSLEMGSA